VSFTVADKELFPEGLAFDPDRRVFYLGSEYQNKIIRIDADHHVSDVVHRNQHHLAPVGGLRVDPVDHTIWAATDSREFVHVGGDGHLIGRFSVSEPGPHILNDLVVTRHHDVYLTDTRAHQLFRFDGNNQTFTALHLRRPLFYPNGIALSADERLLFVADLIGVLVLDLESGDAYEVDPGSASTLAGIDGLYAYENGLVGVQYGTGAYRVMRWRLSRDGRSVTSGEVLEYGTDLLSFPTTGAIVGNDFYFIANTGLDNLHDGHIVDRAKLEPVRLAVVKLP
jgi:hypothetical protein